jgi:hypothetical protein
MELASLFLLILLPPADATGDTAEAITVSLRHELGEVSMVIAPDTVVTPAMWQGEKAPMHARFVVHVTWAGKDKASVEVFSTSSRSAAEGFRRSRFLAFSPQDGKSERGRAIGLVAAELLRESPASVFAAETGARAAAADGPPSHLVLGGMFALERVRSGNWAMGPELTYDLGLSQAVRLQVSAAALFSSTDHYSEFGGGVGGCWDFLHSENGRHALGIGLEVDVLHESALAASDNAAAASEWNIALAVSLSGRVTVWHKLRVISEVDLRAMTDTMSVTVGEDANRTTYSFSRWRPVFAVGLEYAM